MHPTQPKAPQTLPPPPTHQNKSRLGITDIQLSLTSLEEVFLSIARTAEMEAATASTGRASVPVTLEGGMQLEVPIGAEYVLNPATNLQYHIRWGQDEEGRIVISECIQFTEAMMQAAQERAAEAQRFSNRGGSGMGMPVAQPLFPGSGTSPLATANSDGLQMSSSIGSRPPIILSNSATLASQPQQMSR